jgi:diguanylate cyclase (GGDEF)-like protein
MSALIRECRRLERSGADLRFMPGMMPMAQTISLVMKLLWAAWQGDEENARIYAGRAVGSLGGAVTWLDALVHWGLAEVAWMRGNWDAAEASLKEMRACAAAVEHEKLACHSHLLLIQVYELQGKAGMAMLEGRALRSREHRMARESISSREAVVNWQLGARQSERHLEQALEASRQFERWSLEDALTGIANRRAFEMALADKLSDAPDDARSLTLAMVDIDQFKAVNDGYSHQVGDQVLKCVATLLTNCVREGDMAARLAGDEFVVLIGDADRLDAAEVVSRIHEAVASFKWGSLAPGLNVSLSIGLSQAVVGDTVESIMHRSDTSMYTEKARARWVPTMI